MPILEHSAIVWEASGLGLGCLLDSIEVEGGRYSAVWRFTSFVPRTKTSKHLCTRFHMAHLRDRKVEENGTVGPF